MFKMVLTNTEFTLNNTKIPPLLLQILEIPGESFIAK
jgi:hypothetical protein